MSVVGESFKGCFRFLWMRWFKFCRCSQGYIGIHRGTVDILAWVVLWLSFPILGCFSNDPRSGDNFRIVVVCSQPFELLPILERMKNESRYEKINPDNDNIYCYRDKKIYVVIEFRLMGRGMVNATTSITNCISQQCPIMSVIVVGICGSLLEDIIPGTVCVPKEWFQYDGDLTCDYEETKIPQLVPKLDQFQCNEDLFAIAEQMTVKNNENAVKYHMGGNGCSTYVFVDSKATNKILRACCHNVCVVDMETAVVAQICCKRNIPFIAFRAVSDFAGNNDSTDDKNNIDQGGRDQAAKNATFFVVNYLNNITKELIDKIAPKRKLHLNQRLTSPPRVYSTPLDTSPGSNSVSRSSQMELSSYSPYSTSPPRTDCATPPNAPTISKGLSSINQNPNILKPSSVSPNAPDNDNNGSFDDPINPNTDFVEKETEGKPIQHPTGIILEKLDENSLSPPPPRVGNICVIFNHKSSAHRSSQSPLV